MMREQPCPIVLDLTRHLSVADHQAAMHEWIATQDLEVVLGADWPLPGSVYDLVAAIDSGDLMGAKGILAFGRKMAWERHKLEGEINKAA